MADFCMNCEEYIGQNDRNSPNCKCIDDKISQLQQENHQLKQQIAKVRLGLFENQCSRMSDAGLIRNLNQLFNESDEKVGEIRE
jgi:SMC interacting uncharacterized protein involved in chromosome segregation